jgi:peptidoglycan/xylan/chitin deacetylase (PgdA/CDA1 family)
MASRDLPRREQQREPLPASDVEGQENVGDAQGRGHDERAMRPRRRWLSKQRLAEVLAASRVFGKESLDLVVEARRRLSPHPWLTVLTYHRIAEREEAGDLDPDTIDATPAQFEAQIAYLADRYSFVSIAQVLDFLEGGSLPPNPVLITFDDGYAECVERALPILLRHRARAAFFIATDFIDRREIMWWDKLSLLLCRTERPRLELSYPFPVVFDTSSRKARDLALAYLVAIVKTHYALDLPRFMRAVEEAAGVTVDADEERALADRHLMTWSQISTLYEAGMDIGSHTCSHRVLQTLSPGQLARELEGSRRAIERHVGAPVAGVAYPVGYPLDGAERVRRALRDAGYRAGFSNNTGFNSPLSRPDPFDVRRMGMDSSYDQAYFRAFMALPPLSRSRRKPPLLPAL